MNRKALLLLITVFAHPLDARSQESVALICDNLKMNFMDHPILGTGPAKCDNVTIIIRQDKTLLIDEICDIRGIFPVTQTNSEKLKFVRESLVGELNRLNGAIFITEVNRSERPIRTVSGTCKPARRLF